jgi:hypothetical protein
MESVKDISPRGKAGYEDEIKQQKHKKPISPPHQKKKRNSEN